MNLTDLTIDIHGSPGIGNFSFSFAQIEKAVSEGNVKGVIFTPTGTAVGTWRLPAPRVRLDEKASAGLDELNILYADWIAGLYRSGGENKERVVQAFTAAYGMKPEEDEGGSDGEHQFRNLALWTAHQGPVHYVLRDTFREHLKFIGRLDESTSTLFDVDLTPNNTSGITP